MTNFNHITAYALIMPGSAVFLFFRTLAFFCIFAIVRVDAELQIRHMRIIYYETSHKKNQFNGFDVVVDATGGLF